MRVSERGLRGVMVAAAVAIAASGCAVRLSQRSPWDVEQLRALSEQLEQSRTLAQLKSDEADQLRNAKAELERRLSSDISVGFDERGLVVRMPEKILFDPGKAKLRGEAESVLSKVASVLNQQLPDHPVGIEGHTDNEPIRRSGWKDNWELSLARARSVLTDLVQEHSVEPSRLSAIGYGEYRPIAPNDDAESRRMNRRVEIVVLPKGTAQARIDSADDARQSSMDDFSSSASGYTK